MHRNRKQRNVYMNGVQNNDAGDNQHNRVDCESDDSDMLRLLMFTLATVEDARRKCAEA